MIILMGVAGAGKSMQGRLLADERGYAWISTGEILRVLITGTRRQEMLQGKLLSDEERINVMDKVFEIIDPNDEFVLDGFPRTVEQTKWLLGHNDNQRFSRIVLLHLYATEDVVRARLMQRGRLDDHDDAINERFEEYRGVTLPIVEEFRKHNVQVHDIDAARSPEEIHHEIMSILAQ